MWQKFESICSQPTIRSGLRTFFGLSTQSSPGSVQVRLPSIYFFPSFPTFPLFFHQSFNPFVWFTRPHLGALTVKAKPIHLNRMKSHHRQSGFPRIFRRQVAIYTLLLTTQSRSVLKHFRFGMVPKLVLPLQ